MVLALASTVRWLRQGCASEHAQALRAQAHRQGARLHRGAYRTTHGHQNQQEVPEHRPLQALAQHAVSGANRIRQCGNRIQSIAHQHHRCGKLRALDDLACCDARIRLRQATRIKSGTVSSCKASTCASRLPLNPATSR